MKLPSQLRAALGAFALAATAFPLAALAAPAVSHAVDNCAFNFFWNPVTNQCEFCDTPNMYWNVELNACLNALNPVVGPAGPIGVGPDPVVGPVGPVGVGPDPVVGPVGPVGVGGLGPVAGPVGPVGVGR
jgi:hypothetical protein